MTTRICAFLIARMFPDRVPSAAEIMAVVPEISRATAYRFARDYATAWRKTSK